MSANYEKLTNLGYTAYEHSQDFQEKIDENEIKHPLIEVEMNYEDSVPVVEVSAEDSIKGTSYSDTYSLDGVTEEESEEVMFDIWRETMEELEY